MSLSLQKLNNRKVAVIGSGISGLISSWLLRDQAEVSLFEAEARCGGHSNTARVEDTYGELSIDTGFMVFNRPNYPLLSKFFEELGVETYPTDMSFSVCLDGGKLEYAGNSLNSLFAQRKNIIRPSFLGMLRDILKFNASVKKLMRDPKLGNVSLQQFLDDNSLGSQFKTNYLYPMAGAIWSCPPKKIADFPALSFVKFFNNHGLVNIFNRPEWYTVKNGSKSYVERVTKDLGSSVNRSCRVSGVRRGVDKIEICFEDKRNLFFDEVIFACHTDEILKILQNPSKEEVSLLQSVPYQSNKAFLHRDEKVMPESKKVWSSWNYSARKTSLENSEVSVTYWMNSLQQLNTSNNYFVSLNPIKMPKDSLIESEYQYHHPVFNSQSNSLQDKLKKVQGKEKIWFCGAWTGYGFHEDGIRSGVAVARALGLKNKWEKEFEESSSLHKIETSKIGAAA